LMLALWAVGIRSGDEVIVPSMSFISTAECVSQLGAHPQFVDIDQYHTIDLDHLAREITNKTRAIIFVDLYGQTIDIDRIRSIAGTIPVIQDSAQSAGCRYRNKPVGSLADLTCFSFYPGKNLSAMGDAGAVTGRKELIDLVQMIKDHGRKEKYLHELTGWNERLDAVQAAVVSAKIDYLDQWNQRRQSNANIYFELLAECNNIQLPKLNPASSHVYNQFVITTDRRNELKEFLSKQGIEAGIQFPLAMHQQPVYQSHIKLPASEQLAANCLSLPVHAQLTADNVRTVSRAVLNFFSQ
jgi:dTDP-4-amino-4,6-dideoxygalactose transaminase